MTREEELDWLYRLRSEIYVFMPKEWLIPMNNALDMAIKDLEQESSVSENPNNCDLISREAVLENALKIYTHEYGLLEVVGVATIETLPSIKPQTGHWIMRHRKVNTINYRTGEDVLTGEIHTVKELIRYETDEPYCACCGKRAEDISQDYCGYCGARMESEDKE
jgi:hypothetical protein